MTQQFFSPPSDARVHVHMLTSSPLGGLTFVLWRQLVLGACGVSRSVMVVPTVVLCRISGPFLTALIQKWRPADAETKVLLCSKPGAIKGSLFTAGVDQNIASPAARNSIFLVSAPSYRSDMSVCDLGRVDQKKHFHVCNMDSKSLYHL